MIDMDEVITLGEFAEIIGVTPRAARGMAEAGVVCKGVTGRAMLRAYCSHLREVGASRAAAGDLDLAGERAALARAQRERIEMQNAVTRAELAPAAAIEVVLVAAGTHVARILRAVPAAVRARVPSLASEELELVAAEVDKACAIAAAVRLADLG